MSLTNPTLRRAAALGCLLCAPVAIAGPGDHIRTGDTTLTPDLDLGFEYRTNVYRAPTDPISGGNLRIAPGLTLDVDTEQNRFNLAGEWEVRKFLFLAVDQADQRAERIQAVDRFNDFNVSSSLELLKEESVGLRLSDQVTLRNNETDRGVLGNPFITQVRNELDGGLRISPGAALDFVPGGSWAYDDFRVADEELLRNRFNSRHTFGPTLDMRWTFFPRTAFVIEAEGMFHQWSDDGVPVLDPDTGAEDSITVPDSLHVKVQGGIQGRFTERLFIDLIGGYGTAQYQSDTAIPADVEDLVGPAGIIGSAGLRYRLIREGTESVEAGVGFKRDFTDSFFSNFVAYNQLHAQLGADLSGFVPKVRYSLRMEEYSGDVTRSDTLNRVDGELGYNFQEWGKVTGGLAWQQRAVAESQYSDAEYDEFIVRVLSTFTY